MKHKLLLIPVLALAGFTAACDDFEMDFGGQHIESPFHYSYDIQPGGRLELETFNGSVEIRGWDQNKVDISGAKYANSVALRDAIRIDASSSSNGVTVRTVRPPDHHGNMGARFVVRVPYSITLDRISSSNGSVRIEDVKGPVRARTSNGAMTINKVQGEVNAETSNGAIHLTEVTGRSVLRTSNGHIQADHINGAVEADSSNGGIELGFGASPKDQIRATTSNSSISVTMPSTASARVRANTSNGSITTDFDVATQGTSSKNHLEGAINGGGTLLDLTTSNGSIKVLKP